MWVNTWTCTRKLSLLNSCKLSLHKLCKLNLHIHRINTVQLKKVGDQIQACMPKEMKNWKLTNPNGEDTRAICCSWRWYSSGRNEMKASRRVHASFWVWGNKWIFLLKRIRELCFVGFELNWNFYSN